MAKTRFNIGNSQKEKIETQQLKIANNVLIYNQSFVPLQNICYVGSLEVPKEAYSRRAIGLGVLGILLLFLKEAFPVLVGLGLIIYCIYSVYNTYSKNKDGKEYLVIKLNSGNDMLFLFDNHDFLIEVMDVIINCMDKDIEYSIDMSNSSIETCNFNEKFFN